MLICVPSKGVNLTGLLGGDIKEDWRSVSPWGAGVEPEAEYFF